MPNVKGGKGYKRGKNSDEAEKMIGWNTGDGEMLGRVVKVLGSRRFSVYCNDAILRTCRICGSMRKSDWVNLGAIVLVGVRSLGTSLTTTNKVDGLIHTGDIIHLFATSLYKDLKAIPSTNPILFTCVEKRIDDTTLTEEPQDDLFLDEGEEEEGETAADANAKLASEAEVADAKRKEKAKERTLELKSKRELTLDDL